MSEPKPEPEEIRFACIGCGALNPVGAVACSGCGHRFAGPDVAPTPAPARPFVPPERRPLAPDRFYEPPKAAVAPPQTFRIGTLMAFIAVIAVCLAAFAAGAAQGIIVSLGLLPASIRTFLVSAGRQAEGRPMTVGEQIATFCMTILSLVAIVISSAIAFCVTCFPIGVATNGLVVAFVAGGVAALAVAILVGRGFLKIARENAERDRARDQIRWQ